MNFTLAINVIFFSGLPSAACGNDNPIPLPVLCKRVDVLILFSRKHKSFLILTYSDACCDAKARHWPHELCIRVGSFLASNIIIGSSISVFER